MNYRNVAHLNAHVHAWARTLPHDIDLIVGIPRSGLLVANLLALYRNLNLTDLDGLLEGRLLGTGARRHRTGRADRLGSEVLRILVVDDSVETGTAIREAKEKIRAGGLLHEILFGAVYVSPEGRSEVDFYCEVLNAPRIFEWNLFHSWVLEESCVDIDGVLCRDPVDHEDDDGNEYCKFVQDVGPLLLPTNQIGTLVTCRLEKYRSLTEAWLQKHGIAYGELVMMDYPSKVARMREGKHGEFKAEVYNRTGAALFIESSPQQAEVIAKLSGRSVFCTGTMQMFRPGLLPLSNVTTEVADYYRGGRYLNAGRHRLRLASGAVRRLAHRCGFQRLASALREKL